MRSDVLELVTADIGGTHARFALARIGRGGVIDLDDPVTLATGDHAGLAAAWSVFAQRAGRILPRAASIAIASPVEGDTIRLTNNHWVIRPASLRDELGLDRLTLVNDFGAVAHAVAHLGPEFFRPLCGPDRPLGSEEVVSIVGPGTGLGVAQLVRGGGRDVAIEGEGGHIAFAPVDEVEDAILARLRSIHGRVSIERILSGQGLVAIRDTLAALDGQSVEPIDARSLWTQGIEGSDALAVGALDRFCLILGSVAGDIALAHGASAVVIAGGLGLRLADHLPRSGFAGRFVAKGRFEARMPAIPVRILTHPQPGLYGAVAAFAG